MVWSKKVEKILNLGLPLHDMGVNNWALTKKQVFDVLNQFKLYNIPILGGDVYEINNVLPEPNCDGWYYERTVGETLENFISRSILHAKNYIEKYKSPKGKNILFVLVPDDRYS